MWKMHELGISSSLNEQLIEDKVKSLVKAVNKLLLCFYCLNYNLSYLSQYWSVCFVVKVNIVYGSVDRTGKDRLKL